jgi:hypothetical protein
MCQWSWCVCVAVRSGRGWCEVSKFLRCIKWLREVGTIPPATGNIQTGGQEKTPRRFGTKNKGTVKEFLHHIVIISRWYYMCTSCSIV